jgi:hypothetical protein
LLVNTAAILVKHSYRWLFVLVSLEFQVLLSSKRGLHISKQGPSVEIDVVSPAGYYLRR